MTGFAAITALKMAAAAATVSTALDRRMNVPTKVAMVVMVGSISFQFSEIQFRLSITALKTQSNAFPRPDKIPLESLPRFTKALPTKSMKGLARWSFSESHAIAFVTLSFTQIYTSLRYCAILGIIWATHAPAARILGISSSTKGIIDSRKGLICSTISRPASCTPDSSFPVMVERRPSPEFDSFSVPPPNI